MYDAERGYPRVVPFLLYPDAAAAISWLCPVLGFTEAIRYTDDAGAVQHAELVRGDAVLMLGMRGSRHGSNSSITFVLVDDARAAEAEALRRGGTVSLPMVDQPWGLRQVVVDDPQGQRWEISQHLRDTEPGDWGAVQSAPLPGG